MRIEDITPNQAWATKFRIETMVDPNGKPVDTKNLQPGDSVQGAPGIYEGIGVIAVRDVENRKLRVVDVDSHREYVVAWDDCWDVDTVEWITEE